VDGAALTTWSLNYRYTSNTRNSVCECYSPSPSSSSSSPEKTKLFSFLSQLAEEAIYTRFCYSSLLYIIFCILGIGIKIDSFNLSLKELGLYIYLSSHRICICPKLRRESCTAPYLCFALFTNCFNVMNKTHISK